MAAAGLSPAVLLAAGDEVVQADRAGVLTEARFLSLVGFFLAGRVLSRWSDLLSLVGKATARLPSSWCPRSPDLVVLDVAVAGAHGPRARPRG